MYTATNVSRSVRPKEGECSPEYATSLKLVTGQDALSTQCLFTGTAEQSSKGWHAAHGCLAAVRQRRCPFAKFSGQEEFKKGRRAWISLLIISVISQKKKFEEEVYTRPLPLTSCQEDRLGLDYTVLCLRSLMFCVCSFFQFGRTILEGIFRESLLGLPLWRYDHPGF